MSTWRSVGQGQRAAPTHPRARSRDSATPQAGQAELGGNPVHATRRGRGDVAISSQSRPRDCETNGRTEKPYVSSERAGDWCEDPGESDGGGATNHFRLGGACARVLTPWVSRGHRILRRGAPGKGKFCDVGWVLVRSYSVRRPCSPFVVGLLTQVSVHPDGPKAPLWPSECGPRLAVPQLCGKGCSSWALCPVGHRFCAWFRASLFSSPGPSTQCS